MTPRIPADGLPDEFRGKVRRCMRCRKRLRRDAEGWNFEVRNHQVVGFICPGCQTVEENTEAEINDATLDYGLDDAGRLVSRLKTGDAQ